MTGFQTRGSGKGMHMCLPACIGNQEALSDLFRRLNLLE